MDRWTGRSRSLWPTMGCLDIGQMIEPLVIWPMTYVKVIDWLPEFVQPPLICSTTLLQAAWCFIWSWQSLFMYICITVKFEKSRDVNALSTLWPSPLRTPCAFEAWGLWSNIKLTSKTRIEGARGAQGVCTPWKWYMNVIIFIDLRLILNTTLGHCVGISQWMSAVIHQRVLRFYGTAALSACLER